MDQASAKFKGLKADMRKLTHTEVINENSVDTGTIAVRLPKPHDLRVLIHFQQPDDKQVMIAGTKLDVFYPKSLIVQEYDATCLVPHGVAAVLDGFGNIRLNLAASCAG